jgi:antitoxin VapB
MSLNIKNPDTYRLVKELSDLTGESMTAAVTEAVRERLERLRADFAPGEILEIAREIRARLPPGYLDLDHDELLYDENGLPK